MKKNGTTLRKVFNPWNLQSGYPSLRSQSILSKRLTCKVFWNKELSSACLFFSAAGLTFVLTVPVCAFYCLGKGYASHRDDFCCGKRMAASLCLGDWSRDSQFPCLAKCSETWGIPRCLVEGANRRASHRWTAGGGCPLHKREHSGIRRSCTRGGRIFAGKAQTYARRTPQSAFCDSAFRSDTRSAWCNSS